MTAAGEPEATRPPFAVTLLRAMRPHQWAKNLAIFAPLVFSRKLEALLVGVAAFAAFCLAASGNYVLNDVVDAEKDRRHPRKRHRPIAAGHISIPTAIGFAALLEAVGLAAAFLIDVQFGAVLAGYLALMAAYSHWLKRLVIVDVFVIAAGFVIRVMGGAIAIDVEISQWLILCTIFLSLFLGFCKRRAEVVLLEAGGAHHRRTLAEYSAPLLDQMIGICGAASATCYALYTLDATTVEKFGTRNLVFTVPFVVFGLFRYLYLVHQRKEGDSPTTLLFTDKTTWTNILLWFVVVLVIVYG